MFTVQSVRDTSDELHPSVCHTEGAAPVSLHPGGGGGAVNGEDLPPLLLAASCCGGHVVCSLLPGAQQAVSHQPLPWATEIRPVMVRGGGGGGGGSTVAPPDGVAGGEHGDSVVPERRKRRIQQLTDFYIQC